MWWSIVIFVTELILFPNGNSFEIIDAKIASTIDLPCSTSQINESSNPIQIVWIRDDLADIVSLDTSITVRDARLKILSSNGVDRIDRILRITNIQENDGGLYRCLHNDLTLKEVSLNVLVPPEIVAHSPKHMPIITREGRDIRFTCQATGRPSPIISWNVNGLSRPGTMMKTPRHNTSQLILHNISRFDSGPIECSATNQLNTVSRHFLLRVDYKPLISISPKIIHPRRQEPVTFSCHVCSSPSVVNFDIFRPNQTTPVQQGILEKAKEVLNDSCQQLNFTMLVRCRGIHNESFFGVYFCRARNSLGFSSTHFIIKKSLPQKKQATVSDRPSLVLTNSATTGNAKISQIHSAFSKTDSMSIFEILFFVYFIVRIQI